MQVLDALITTIRPYQSVLIGYSGGVDSTLVAVAARRALGRDSVLAVLGRRAPYPPQQRGAGGGGAAPVELPPRALSTPAPSTPTSSRIPPTSPTLPTAASTASPSCGLASARSHSSEACGLCATAPTPTTCTSIGPGTLRGGRREFARRSRRRV